MSLHLKCFACSMLMQPLEASSILIRAYSCLFSRGLSKAGRGRKSGVRLCGEAGKKLDRHPPRTRGHSIDETKN